MKIDEKIVNNIRVLASDVVSNAKSGHTGIVLSAAPIIYTLFLYSPHNYFLTQNFLVLFVLRHSLFIDL